MKSSPSSRIGSTGVAIAKVAFEEADFLFRELLHHDVGVDAQVELLKGDCATGRLVGLQIKSGGSYHAESTGDFYVVRFDDQHVRYWLEYALPVVMVLVDIERRCCHWQLVAQENLQRTLFGWKLLIPKAQIVGPATLEAFGAFASGVVPSNWYTILELSDCSHALAKRYSAHVLLTQSSSPREIESAVRSATRLLRNEDYHRNKMAAAHWRSHPAHQVTLWVYPTLEDRRDVNWICMSEWIDPSLPEDLRSLSLKGRSIGDDIVVDWSRDYASRRAFNVASSVSKGAFLARIDEIVGSLVPAVATFSSWFASTSASAVPPLVLLDGIREATQKGFRIGIEPVECAEVRRRFEEMVCSANNMVLPYLENTHVDWTEPQRTNIVRSAVSAFGQSQQRFAFELEKIR